MPESTDGFLKFLASGLFWVLLLQGLTWVHHKRRQRRAEVSRHAAQDAIDSYLRNTSLAGISQRIDELREIDARGVAIDEVINQHRAIRRQRSN